MTTPQMADIKNLFNVDQDTQSVSFTTGVLNLQQYGRYALQVNITSQSSLNCTISVQSTIDYKNWATVPGSAVSFTSNQTYIWDNFGSGVTQSRLSIAFTGGSAIFEVYGFAKI